MIKNLIIMNKILKDANLEEELSIKTKIKICKDKNLYKYFLGEKYRVPYQKDKSKRVGTLIVYDDINNEYKDFFTNTKYRVLEENELAGINERINIEHLETKIKTYSKKRG